jgi:hypothetical protein
MTTNAIAARTKQPLNPLRIASSALFLLFGILSLISAVQMFSFYSSPFFFYITNFSQLDIGVVPYLLLDLVDLLTNIGAPIASIFIAVVGLRPKRKWRSTILGAALFFVTFSFGWLLDLVQGRNVFMWTQNITITEEGQVIDSPLGWSGLICLGLAVMFSILASALSPNTAEQFAQPEAAVVPQSTQPSPTTAQPSGQSNLANLPLFALIGAFIIPLAGIILGHLSLSYMKKGQLSTQNKGMATAGLILGYVFVGLGFLVGLILFIVLIVSAASGF